MKQKKNAFTLIELLAVIVILAIIALIAVPVILNIIDKANIVAFKDTAYGIISAGELYFAERQLDLEGMKENKTFTFPNATGLELKGKLPESGSMTVNKEGKVSLSISNGRYCVTKGFNDTEVTLTEGECNEQTKEIAVGDPIYFNPGSNKICEGYTEANSQTGVKDGCMKWYVYKIEGDNLHLILDHNTTAKVAWYKDEDDNTWDETNEYPYTLMAQLEEDTTNWNVRADVIELQDLLNMLPWYKNLTDKTNWEELYFAKLDDVWADVEENVPYEETVEGYKAQNEYLIANHSDIILPRYMFEDLVETCRNVYDEEYDEYYVDCDTWRYWTKTAVASSSNRASYVYYAGHLVYDIVINDDGIGLRPVTTLSKEKLNEVPEPKILINDIVLEEADIETYERFVNINVTVSPSNVSNQQLEWMSSDESVATVDKNGLVTGISGGTTTITVSTTDGSNISKTINIIFRRED